MRKNLTKANEIIHDIQNNLNNSKRLRENCSELQDLIQYLQPETKYHYLLFLAQIYASKLREFTNAQKICRSIMQDPRPSVELEGTLRLAFILALQHKYNQAIKMLQQADNLSDRKQQLQAIFIDFCHRLFVYSKQCNLLQGLKSEYEQLYQDALNFYNIEFESEVISGQIEAQYFAARAIIQITKIFPNRKFKTVDPKKCQNYVLELYEEKGEHDDHSVIQKLDQNYMAQKSYLTKIVELMKQKQQSIKTTKRILSKNAEGKFSTDIKHKQLLAILKLQKALKNQPDLNDTLRNQFQKCSQQLKQNRVGNYNLVNQFTIAESKLIGSINQRMKIKAKRIVMDLLKTFTESSQIPKPHPITKNLFKNQPTFHPSYKTSHEQPSLGFGNYKFKATFSQQQVEDIDAFEGSYMQKIHETSSGHEKRYFYFVKTQLQKGKLKLYYSSKRQNTSSDDSYYEIKNFIAVEEGKKTKALNRSDCERFDESRCFAIIYGDNKSKNFYVPQKKDYRKWMQVFRKYELVKANKSKKSISPNKKPSQSVVNKLSPLGQSKLRKTIFY